MSKTSRLRGRSLSVLEDLIEERDKLNEDSKEYNDLTEEIQLIQNDMVTIDIMEDKQGRTWMNDQNEDTTTEDEKDYKQIQKDLTELNPDGDEEGIEYHVG